MKKLNLFALLSSFALLLVACQDPTNSTPSNSESVSEEFVEVDYVSQTKLDTNNGKVWAEVQVHNYVDGDTTHFLPVGNPTNWVDTPKGILKARYNSCDTLIHCLWMN